MARHVAEGTAAEIVEAAPIGGLVEIAVRVAGRIALPARGVGARLGTAQPQVPIQSVRNRSGFGDVFHALRPDRPVGPGMYFSDAANFPVPDHLGALTRAFVGVSLVTHLGCHAVLGGGFAEHARFPHGPRQGFLYVHVLSALHASHGRYRVHEIRDGHDAGIKVLALLIEHLAVVFEFRLFVELLVDARCLLVVNVAQRHDVLRRSATANIAGRFAATPDRCHIELFIGRFVASIGCGGKASSDIRGCAATENIVALCDVDDKQAAGIYKQFDKQPKFKDYRKMLDQEGKNFDACIVTIPDFMHAVAAMACMERGKHVYVQKPLTRTVWEARMLREAAAKYRVATQMGNQGYSNEGTRQCAEMIWNGEIGGVTEVHAWTNRPIWPQGVKDIPEPTAVPDTLDWDLWLGCAKPRPYTSGGQGYPAGYANGNFYQPSNWRGFYDFGCGSLGDMACHILGAPNLSLNLSKRAPTSVECVKKEGVSGFMFPQQCVLRFDFPAFGNMPPVKVFWYDFLKEQPKINGVPEGEYLGDMPRPSRPQGQQEGQQGQARGGRGQGAGRGAGAPQMPRNEGTGQVFNWAMV